MKTRALPWKTRWQDVLVALLGAWFAVSPWVLDLHEVDTAIVAASVALGPTLLALAVGALVAPRRWEHWTQAAVAVGIAASPWLLGFADDSVAWRNAVAVGLLATLLPLWAMVREKEGRAVLRGTEELAH